MFAAILLASSRVSNLAADLLSGDSMLVAERSLIKRPGAGLSEHAVCHLAKHVVVDHDSIRIVGLLA